MPSPFGTLTGLARMSGFVLGWSSCGSSCVGMSQAFHEFFISPDAFLLPIKLFARIIEYWSAAMWAICGSPKRIENIFVAIPADIFDDMKASISENRLPPR